MSGASPHEPQTLLARPNGIGFLAKARLKSGYEGPIQTVEMHRLLPLLSMSLAIVAAAPSTAAARHTPTQTKTQAEVNVLRAIARKSHKWRMPGLVNAHTHLLTDNTEAVCHGLGGKRAGNRYARFVCVVRPHVHRGRQGLHVSYRVLPKNRFELRFLAYRRR
jgi:hypothetical protein